MTEHAATVFPYFLMGICAGGYIAARSARKDFEEIGREIRRVLGRGRARGPLPEGRPGRKDVPPPPAEGRDVTAAEEEFAAFVDRIDEIIARQGERPFTVTTRPENLDRVAASLRDRGCGVLFDRAGDAGRLLVSPPGGA